MQWESTVSEISKYSDPFYDVDTLRDWYRKERPPVKMKLIQDGEKVWSPKWVKSSFQKEREAAEKSGMSVEMKEAIKAAAAHRAKIEWR